jgi:Holliday junction resolvase-like predicted endonuclease
VPRDVKGEIDLIGYDGETLVFEEERTAREDHLGAVRGECDRGETAPGWPHGATVSDGEARERVAVRFDVMAIEEFPAKRQW